MPLQDVAQEYLSISQAACFLGVSESYVRKTLVRTGELKHSRLGNRIRIAKTDINAMMDKRWRDAGYPFSD